MVRNSPSEPIQGTNPADTLILNFWPSELWENTFQVCGNLLQQPQEMNTYASDDFKQCHLMAEGMLRSSVASALGAQDWRQKSGCSPSSTLWTSVSSSEKWGLWNVSASYIEGSNWGSWDNRWKVLCMHIGDTPKCYWSIVRWRWEHHNGNIWESGIQSSNCWELKAACFSF